MHCNFRLIFLYGWNQIKILHALLSSKGFIFSWASDEIYLIEAFLLPHTRHNERIFPQSVKADPSFTFRNFIKPT